MTVGTNALLEERGARTALIATRGFADLLEIGRQDRPELYRLCAPKPAPLVDAGAALRGRASESGPEGVVEPLADDGAGAPGRAAARRAAPSRSPSACSSPTSTPPTSGASPTHLRRAPARTSTSPPPTRSCPASASTSAARRRRSTPTSRRLLGRYLDRLGDAAAAAGLPRAAGDAVLRRRRHRRGGGARRRLERPLGTGRRRGRRRPPRPRPAATATRSASTWAAPPATSAWSRTGEVRRTDSRTIGGRVIQLPMVDVHTVGAGGGSIGWRDRGRRPAGRAALGRAPSRDPPATDAAAASRRSPTPTCCSAASPPTRELAGGVDLDAEAARAAVSDLAESLGLDELETAEGIVRVANQEMVRALRVVTRRARRRPARLRPASLRRRRADARRGDRSRARHRAHPLPARGRRPLGARPLRLGPSPRHRPAR